ncbi:fibulin-2 isoform X2 [Melanotaenia boesemani]|uniref:fibulin-2 isoform X2 n=1 Tax=Melanotaenia boesemani TaxID=1250792 RepID=UPI001C045E18|nr:fibulin-2 isoform X2 [Melanotaenia boesemani]
MARPEASLLRCGLLFLYLSVYLCQHDCTGVDCPLLDNCIEEVLENSACCASCLQKGCTCEGYQYYDCVNAGFKNGKVPEGDSYFVDYGSTECSCPLGGGRISCQFISCPDLPANCIDVLEPTDGCMQCERIGCLHHGQKYEAGHSFHADHCWLCHCPDEGGDVMCSRVPCDSQKVYEGGEDKISGRLDSYPFDQNKFSTASHELPNGHLPLFKLPPSDKEESEDNDYTPVDFLDTYPPFMVPPTQSSTSSKKVSSASQDSARPDRAPVVPSLNVPAKMELREQYGVHDHPTEREEMSQSPSSVEQGTVGPHIDATTSWQLSQRVSFGDSSPHPVSENPFHGQRSFGSVIVPLNQEFKSEKEPEKYPDVNSESVIHHQRGGRMKTQNQNASDNVTLSPLTNQMKATEASSNQEKGSEIADIPLYMLRNAETLLHSQSSRNDPEELHEPDDKEILEEDETRDQEEEIPGGHGNDVPFRIKSTPQSSDPTSSYERIPPAPSTASPRNLENWEIPEAYFITTTKSPSKVKLDESLSSGKLPHGGGREVVDKDHEGSHRQVSLLAPEGDPGVSAKVLLQDCCTAGQRWARENLHCSHMPELNDKHSVCSMVWKQCCLSTVKESQCESGVTSARAGHTCEGDEEHPCRDDSHQVCCSCCALGLWMRRGGQDCEAPQRLSYPCNHIFLTCCEDKDGVGQLPVRRKEKLRPTALPRRVSDRKLPTEAFSIRAPDQTANAVEEQPDVDECRLDQGQLCQHTCSNIWGSYRCGCHRGFILQDDGHSCAPVSPEEDNIRDINSPAVGPVQSTTSATTSSPVHLDPCTGNSACSQQCLPVAGRAHCFCFPGFSLMADGRTCEDVDECGSNTHSCRPGERCVNTMGLFVCERQVACPAGYQLNGGVCQDMDECAVGSDNCGEGFMCENTAGSFLCSPRNKCITGFMQDSHGNCIDINECSSLDEPCSSGSYCINTVGSYTCQQKMVMCSHGFHAGPDGARCVDVDECQMGAHRCGGGQICHNLPGSYRCDCQTGYQFDALRKTCTDVNECDNNPCSQECANIYGSYQCYCQQGYFLKEDGHTCEDIDECSQSIMNLCTFQCINVAGSYQCTCPPHGYVMSASGRTCTDVDECSTGTHNCSFEQTCYNLQGGFRCLSFDCPHNYKKVSDTRCERISCPSNSLDCQNSPVRITYYQLSYQTNIIIPAQIFRIGPSPTYSGDHIVISITKGNRDGYFSTRKLNSFTGAVYLQRKVRQPKDFLIEVEMKLLRQGTLTSFLARIYVFITSSNM